jgi:hypothetical protein
MYDGVKAMIDAEKALVAAKHWTLND